jgi:hypothetical protein
MDRERHARFAPAHPETREKGAGMAGRGQAVAAKTAFTLRSFWICGSSPA